MAKDDNVENIEEEMQDLMSNIESVMSEVEKGVQDSNTIEFKGILEGLYIMCSYFFDLLRKGTVNVCGESDLVSSIMLMLRRRRD